MAIHFFMTQLSNNQFQLDDTICNKSIQGILVSKELFR